MLVVMFATISSRCFTQSRASFQFDTLAPRNVFSIEKSPTTLTENEVESLATAFAAAIPEYEFSPAQIQGKSRK